MNIFTMSHYKLKAVPWSATASLYNLGECFSACGCVFLIATSAVYLFVYSESSLPFFSLPYLECRISCTFNFGIS